MVLNGFSIWTGMEKVNFSGGEPFIVKRGTYVGELVRYCKEDLQLASVSIVSNGSLVTEPWFQKYGRSLNPGIQKYGTSLKTGSRNTVGHWRLVPEIRYVTEDWFQKYGRPLKTGSRYTVRHWTLVPEIRYVTEPWFQKYGRPLKTGSRNTVRHWAV